MNPPMVLLIILLIGGFVNKCNTENKLAKLQKKMERIEKRIEKQPKP